MTTALAPILTSSSMMILDGGPENARPSAEPFSPDAVDGGAARILRPADSVTLCQILTRSPISQLPVTTIPMLL